jgi:hypothetical protein
MVVERAELANEKLLFAHFVPSVIACDLGSA